MSFPEADKIRILLADDQELVAMGFRTVIAAEPDLEIVAITNNFDDTLALAQQHLPDLILLECMMQEGHCVERIPELISAYPAAKILVMTACLNQDRHLTVRNLLVIIYSKLGVENHVELMLKADQLGLLNAGS